MELPALLGEVKELIVETLELDIAPEEIEDEETLFGNLGLDSISMLELIEALEQTFGIEVDDEDLSPELTESARSLAEYVLKKTGRQVGVSPERNAT
jgi:acyl carrier protein